MNKQAIVPEEQVRTNVLRQVAERMAIAARTAPKAKGKDLLSIAIADAQMIARIADKMDALVATGDAPEFFSRDAGNIRQAPVMLLLGTAIETMGVRPCGLCGFGNCKGKREHPDAPCAFNTGDLGIALGSAVSIATNARVDNRILFSAGMAVKQLGIFPPEVAVIYAIPLSATGKNPFFDRG